MANQLKMADIEAIVALHAQGWSYRWIAQRLGIHRETVSRYVRLADSKPANLHAGTKGVEADPKPANLHTGDGEPVPSSPSHPPTRARQPTSHCEPWRQVIKAQLEAGLTAQRIHQDLVAEHGFTRSYSTVQRYVRHLIARERSLPFRRMECSAGEEAQVDFGTGAPIVTAEGRRRRPHVFRIVLSYSRKAYSEAVERQTTDTFLHCLENAFAYFGGVPRTLVIDNLRAAVSRADWYEPELNPKLRAFAAHYGTVILPTRPRMPRHKGKVERGIGYVKGNSLKGRTFANLEEQNQHLRTWETHVADCRIHGTTRRHVGVVFREREQPALLPLPAERFPMFHEAERLVHRDGHVAVERAYYSVPPEYLARQVWVRWDARLVRIFNRQMQQIAVHVRHEPGRFSTQSAHIAAEKTSGIERGARWLLGRARLIGPHAQCWASAMLEARGIEGLRVLQGLLALAGKHESATLEQACRIATSYRAYRLRTVRELVKRQAPTQAEFDYTASHPLIRDLADYAAVARCAMERTSLAGGGRDQQAPQVPSPDPPAAGASPTSFPSSLFPNLPESMP